MMTSTHTLPRTGQRRPATGRGAVLLTATAAITFFTTGAGMLEGHAVYPSWIDLANYADFAGYHGRYGVALLPWLPLPLAIATVLNIVLVFRRPNVIPRAWPVATLLIQLVVVAVTIAVAIPIQGQLATPGHSPAEIIALVHRLQVVGWWRDVPGLAVAFGFLVMLHRAIRGRS